MSKELTAAFHDLYRDPYGFDWDRVDSVKAELLAKGAADEREKIAAWLETSGWEEVHAIKAFIIPAVRNGEYETGKAK